MTEFDMATNMIVLKADVPPADIPPAAVPPADAPIAVAPLADVPLADVPMADAPLAEAPLAEAPLAEAPLAGPSMVDAPMADSPSADSPSADAPLAGAPWADPPSADTPMADSPSENPKRRVGSVRLNIEVRRQDDTNLIFLIKETTPFEKLMKVYCEKSGLPANGVRLLYNGVQVARLDTPLSRNMKDGDVLEALHDF